MGSSSEDLQKQIASLADTVGKLAQVVGNQGKPASTEKSEAPKKEIPTFDNFVQGLVAPAASSSGSIFGNIGTDLAKAALQDFIKAGGQLPAGVTPEAFAAQYGPQLKQKIFNSNPATSLFTGPSSLGGGSLFGGGGLNLGGSIDPLGSLGSSLFGGIGGSLDPFGALGVAGGDPTATSYLQGLFGTDFTNSLGYVNAIVAQTQAEIGPSAGALGANPAASMGNLSKLGVKFGV